MRKELVFKQTEHTCFISLLNNNISIADTSDYVGTYAVRDGKNYVCGVNELSLPSTFVSGWGNDPDTPAKDGFDYGEEMFIFHYDSQQDKFFKVNGFILQQGVNLTPASQIKFTPLAIYLVINPSIGEEITLEINEELTYVELTGNVATEPIKTNGFNTVQLSYTAINTTLPQFFVALGSGRVIDDKYMFVASDTNVIINIVATDIFTGELLTSQIKFTLDQSPAIIAETEDYLIYLKSDKIMFKSKGKMITGRFYNEFGKYYTFVGLRPETEKMIVGDYLNKKGKTFTFIYDLFVGGKRENAKPIINTITF